MWLALNYHTVSTDVRSIANSSLYCSLHDTFDCYQLASTEGFVDLRNINDDLERW